MDEMHIYKYTVLIYSYLQHSIYSLCLIKNIADNVIVSLKINIIFCSGFHGNYLKPFSYFHHNMTLYKIIIIQVKINVVIFMQIK